MNGARNAWIAARARNAARRGGWIAGIGGVSAILTLFAFVVVPRELDRQLRLRIAALPLPADSTPIVRQLDSLRARQRDTLISLDSALLRSASVLPGSDTAFARVLRRDSLGMDSSVAALRVLVERARNSPLPDSYRALAESPFLRSDPSTAARVASLVQSIDQVDREREAHAALGGPGARYAALTARMTALGQSLIRIAEQQLPPTDSVNRPIPLRIGDPSVGTALSPLATPLISDSARRVAADSLSRLVAVQETLLVARRKDAAEYTAQRSALEQRLNVEVPPFAMLISALIVGVAVGYGAVFAREVRWPTVGDASEVERISGAQVLVHSQFTPGAPAAKMARRERRFVPTIIDRDSDTFLLLHLALSGVGDAVPQVEVLADDPVLAAGVAMGTAAAAARESRAVLVVESTMRRPLLAHLLRVSPKLTREDVLAGRATPDEAVHVVALDGDTHIDTIVAGSREVRRPMRGRRTPHPLAAMPEDEELIETMLRFEQRYDLRLYLTDPAGRGRSRIHDVILCVRQGSTPLRWLARTTQHVRSRQQRIRAVVVWGRDLPTVS